MEGKETKPLYVKEKKNAVFIMGDIGGKLQVINWNGEGTRG